MRRTRILVAACSLTLMLFGALYAPGLALNPLDATVTLNVATSLAVAEMSVNFGSIAGFTSGTQAPVTLNLNAKCNKKTGYKIYVKGVDFTSADGDPTSFPLSDLEFLPNGGSYTPMATSDQVARGTSVKTPVAGDDFTVPVRLILLGSEAAGTYTTTLTFTIVSN